MGKLYKHLGRGAVFGALLAGTATQAYCQEAKPAATATSAADTADEPADSIDIVVTAQKRTERLQDVPIAITAMTPEQISDRNAISVTDLLGSVPSLSVTSFGAASGSNLFSLRGVAGQPVQIGGSQAVAFYLDGVYLPRPDSIVFALDDVERVEVLRGPQGTLYGRNSTAGAINIVTRDPGKELRGGFDVSYGNLNQFQAKGSVSGPIGGGFSAGLSGTYNSRDGYFINNFNGHRVDGQIAYTVRGKLRYVSPTGNFSAVLAGDYAITDGPEFMTNIYNLQTGAYLGIGDGEHINVDAGDKSFFKINSKGGALTLNYDVSDHLQLTSVTSLRRIRTDTAFDPDGSPTPLLFIAARNINRTFYQEVRALAKYDRFRATVGLNYFDEDADYAQSLRAPNLPLVYETPHDTSKVRTYAAFGQLEYDLTDNLTAVAGLRYNTEKRDFTVDYSHSPTPGNFTAGKLEASAAIPSFGVNFKATPDLLLYAKVSKGWQAPGFGQNPGATAPTNIFGAETLWAYEGGIKSQFFDRRLTLNLAGFYYDYSDIQVRSVVGIGLTRIENAASATVKGLELEATANVAQGLTFSGHLAYTNAKYDKYCQPISAATPQGTDPLCSAGFADRAGNFLNHAPEWNGSLNVDYRLPVSDAGELKFHADYVFESNLYYSTVNEPTLSSGGWHKVGGRVAFQFARGPEIYVYGRNLGNKFYLSWAQRNSPSLVPSVISDAPRSYGAGVSFKF